MSEAMQKGWRALVVGVAVFNLVAGAAVAAGATDDSGAGRVYGAGLMLLGGAAMLGGLSIRTNNESRSNTLIAVGALPALLWFWYLIPAVAAIAVVTGSILEHRRLFDPAASS